MMMPSGGAGVKADGMSTECRRRPGMAESRTRENQNSVAMRYNRFAVAR